MARETSVNVREIDRRVLLVHGVVEVGRIPCVESDYAARPSTPVNGGTGFTLLLSKAVEDAEGLDRELPSEDVTGENRPRGPSNKDTTRWK